MSRENLDTEFADNTTRQISPAKLRDFVNDALLLDDVNLMDGGTIKGLTDPVDSGDAATKHYVDGQVSTPNLSTVLNVGNDANGDIITNLGDPQNAQDAATKNYVEGISIILKNYVDGQVSTPNLSKVLNVGNDANGDIITNLGNPQNAQDAATKHYVDGQVSTPNLSTVLNVGNDANGDIITNLGNPQNAQDAATKHYVDGQVSTPNLSTVLNVGNDANGDIITNLGDPQNAQDAATKNYVDTLGGGGNPFDGLFVTGAANFILSDGNFAIGDAYGDGQPSLLISGTPNNGYTGGASGNSLISFDYGVEGDVGRMAFAYYPSARPWDGANLGCFGIDDAGNIFFGTSPNAAPDNTFIVNQAANAIVLGSNVVDSSFQAVVSTESFTTDGSGNYTTNATPIIPGTVSIWGDVGDGDNSAGAIAGGTINYATGLLSIGAGLNCTIQYNYATANVPSANFNLRQLLKGGQVALDWSDGCPKLPNKTTITSPQEGMIAWNFTTHLLTVYNGSAWV